MPAPVSVDAAPTIVGGLNQHERFGRSQFCNPMITLSGFTGAVDKSGDFLSQVCACMSAVSASGVVIGRLQVWP
jgi:hypothetical protein